MEEVHEYVQKRIMEEGHGHSSMDEVNKYVAEWMEIVNGRPLDKFDGFSPTEMQSVMYNLFGKGCPVQLNDFTLDDCAAVPLFRQVKLLLEIVNKENGVKLTTKGNLPLRVVKAMYDVGAPYHYIEVGMMHLRSEDNSISVATAHIVTEIIIKAVKKRYNTLSLTKKGKELLTDDRKLLRELLFAMLSSFNSAYFDGYSSKNIGIVGRGFSLILLDRYGDIEREDSFYADKYFKAFPMLMEEADERYSTREKIALHCYSLRIFDFLFYQLGLVTVKKIDKYTDTYNCKIRKTDLFNRLFKILSPVN